MRRRLTKSKACPLCSEKIVLDYKDVVRLGRYISERGKILGRAKSGVCAKHQRQLTRAIKRARFVALLPYVQR